MAPILTACCAEAPVVQASAIAAAPSATTPRVVPSREIPNMMCLPKDDPNLLGRTLLGPALVRQDDVGRGLCLRPDRNVVGAAHLDEQARSQRVLALVVELHAFIGC